MAHKQPAASMIDRGRLHANRMPAAWQSQTGCTEGKNRSRGSIGSMV